MDLVTKIVTLIGAVAGVVGLFWMLTGYIDYLQGRKNKDRSRQDEGIESIVYGLALSAGVGGICATIVVALNAIPF